MQQRLKDKDKDLKFSFFFFLQECTCTCKSSSVSFYIQVNQMEVIEEIKTFLQKKIAINNVSLIFYF